MRRKASFRQYPRHHVHEYLRIHVHVSSLTTFPFAKLLLGFGCLSNSFHPPLVFFPSAPYTFSSLIFALYHFGGCVLPSFSISIILFIWALCSHTIGLPPSFTIHHRILLVFISSSRCFVVFFFHSFRLVFIYCLIRFFPNAINKLTTTTITKTAAHNWLNACLRMQTTNAHKFQ